MESAPLSAQLSKPLLPRVGRDAEASPVVDDVEETTGDGGAEGPTEEEIRTDLLVESGIALLEIEGTTGCASEASVTGGSDLLGRAGVTLLEVKGTTG